jgi:choline dehydrogenase-like flavoprotein
MSCVEVAVRDEPSGEISTNKKGRLVVKKSFTGQDAQRRDDGLQAIDNVFHAAGAREVIRSPYHFGLHLMGGCVMGSDPDESVVNEDFQVHGHPNLYVADSSIFPEAPGINPSLTIMALSDRLSKQLAGTGK